MATTGFASREWSAALAPLGGSSKVICRKPEGRLSRAFARYFAWRARRATLQMLGRLDGATLRDLGINDIESQVYGDPDGRRRAYDPNWWRSDR